MQKFFVGYWVKPTRPRPRSARCGARACSKLEFVISRTPFSPISTIICFAPPKPTLMHSGGEEMRGLPPRFGHVSVGEEPATVSQYMYNLQIADPNFC